MKDYKKSEEICKEVLNADGQQYSALSLMAAIKRNTGKFDDGLQYCDKMLAINNEDIYAFGQKARIELKRKNDKQAAIYAARAMQINPENDFALESMAMVDHYAGRKNESLAKLNIIKSHLSQTGDSTVYNRVNSIIDGSVKYR